MSLKKNIVASYGGQLYVTLISIVMLPLYLRYLGAEAYGLVGFFTMLQAWFQLLDLGLTPTMARETARFNGGATTALSLRRLLRALEGIFLAIALLGGAAMVAGSGAIATGWLKVESLPLVTVQQAIMLMAAGVSLRWVSGLYRGAINGFERIVWLSGFNAAIATLRFVLVLPFFVLVSTQVTHFFLYQAAVALLELAVLMVQTYRLMPALPAGRPVAWDWQPLRGVLKFSLSIAFTSSVWVFVTQTDKLMLSKLLPLTEYAYITLAIMVASGVTAISGPIASALMPRMTKLSAEGDEAGLIALYRRATQVVCVIAVPASLVLALFSRQVLTAWTGDAHIADVVAPALSLYALGNGILGLGAFPYYLQFAKGDLRLHLIGNALFLVLLVPGLIVATLQYGVLGAGCAWLGANVVYFLLWVPKVHRRFVQGLHRKWLVQDIGPIVLSTVAAGCLLRLVLHWPAERALAGIQIVVVSVALVAVAALGSSSVRSVVQRNWQARQA
jgi:O-antigen/teichoic acid export membrane protein